MAFLTIRRIEPSRFPDGSVNALIINGFSDILPRVKFSIFFELRWDLSENAQNPEEILTSTTV